MEKNNQLLCPRQEPASHGLAQIYEPGANKLDRLHLGFGLRQANGKIVIKINGY
jgi:hypothetical protein